MFESEHVEILNRNIKNISYKTYNEWWKYETIDCLNALSIKYKVIQAVYCFIWSFFELLSFLFLLCCSNLKIEKKNYKDASEITSLSD